jgi:hypothetical protein
MSEAMTADKTAREQAAPPAKNLNLRPWKPGQSGNPKGRPKIEARVRRYARKYDRAMCKVLAEIAQDTKLPAAERRRAAMDLIAVGSGRPAVVQEIAGRAGEPLGPLVALNFGATPGQPLSPEQAYRAMLEGVIPVDPSVFRPVIEAPPSEEPTS